MSYISSLSLSSPMRQSVLATQTALAQAQAESSSGAPADLGLTLGARTGTVLSMRGEVDRLQGYADGNAVAATRLSATDATLASMLATAQKASASLIAAPTAGGDLGATATDAGNALASLVSGLNATAGGQALFGGINTGTAPIADDIASPSSAIGGAIAAAFTTFVGANGGDASALSAAQLRSFIDTSVTPLFQGAGWSAASATAARTTIAPGETVTTSISADEGAFRQLAEAYTIVSTLTGTGSALSAAAKAGVVGAATTMVQAGIAGLSGLQTRVGTAQAAIDDAGTRTSAQVAALQGSAADLDSVDVYALSNRVSALQTQLQASYELTNRLQSLSLTTYLTGG